MKCENFGENERKRMFSIFYFLIFIRFTNWSKDDLIWMRILTTNSETKSFQRKWNAQIQTVRKRKMIESETDVCCTKAKIQIKSKTDWTEKEASITCTSENKCRLHTKRWIKRLNEQREITSNITCGILHIFINNCFFIQELIANGFWNSAYASCAK